ncbi:MAG: DUF3990 domain-containing protein [Oscillospiraceae bacterium]|nr:DUF3990 domain-containing protein [Oscillospiraceae bacterium]
MKLYHTGSQIIREPDVRYGRKNADFGQGFYLTPDLDFARRWARDNAILNEYELDLSGLTVHRFSRDTDWFEYIFHNRRASDSLHADVVIGPIANDTIFDTLGMIISGYLAPEEALKLLLIGPEYTQVAVKTERAAWQLRWLAAEPVPRQDEEQHAREQNEYLQAFTAALVELAGGE